METIILFTCEHAQIAHWIIFGLIMLAGLNVPISEDLLVLTAGSIASQCPSYEVFPIYLLIFLACWTSAWEAYALGRFFGPKLYKWRWFKRFITEEKIENLQKFYEKYGIFTFIVGRFIPGGVRNALFMSAGLGKMPFTSFILRDGVGCLLASSFLFTAGYLLAQNITTVLDYIKTYHTIALILIVLTIITAILIQKWRKSLVSNTKNR